MRVKTSRLGQCSKSPQSWYWIRSRTKNTLRERNSTTIRSTMILLSITWLVANNGISNWPYTPPSDENSPKPHSTKLPSTTQAVIFGLGSMFNHSALHQNVGWERDLKNLLVTYITLRDIEAGEELCISYGPCLTFKDCDADREPPPDDWTELQSIIDLID